MKYAWKNLSVKYKLFLVIALPLLLTLFFVVREVNVLMTQMSSLQKAKEITRYLKSTSSLYQNYTTFDLRTLHTLEDLSPSIFGSKSSEVNEVLHDFHQTFDIAAQQSTDLYEQIDNNDWQAELYSRLLIYIENSPIAGLPLEVKHHLSALIQLEWLMSWSTQEYGLIESSIAIAQETKNYDEELTSRIQSLIERQNLFVERFIQLNADEQQVNLMLEVFQSDVFANNQNFRTDFLSDPNALSIQDVTSGLNTLSATLQLKRELGDEIRQQLVNKIDSAIYLAQKQITLFIAFMAWAILVTILVIFSIANRITQKLQLVLNFLTHDNPQELKLLTQQIKSKDEFGLFAQEVERITLEQQIAQDKIIKAKEQAERSQQKAIEASKAKSSFLANMSHEIRTPLNGVIGMAEILSDSTLSATQKDYVDTISVSSHILLNLINDILDFSKIESGMLLISPHQTNIRETIYDVASIVSPKAKTQGIGFDIFIAPDVPTCVLIDDHRIRQILMNFLSNAIKFTLKGKVGISLTTSELSRSSAKLTFAVQDSGIGIDEEQQKNIFSSFSQADESTTRQFGGTGLGLAISTQLVELMGSTIKLDSVKGEGSCFSFTLETEIVKDEQAYKSNQPNNDTFATVSVDRNIAKHIEEELHFFCMQNTQYFPSIDDINMEKPFTWVIYIESTPNEAMTKVEQFRFLTTQGIKVCLIKHFLSEAFDFEDSITSLVSLPFLGRRLFNALQTPLTDINLVPSEPASNKTKSKPRILIVEDNKVNQKIAGLHVKKAGYDYDIANNGQEAIERFISGGDYALILMDCMMPGMDGFTATEKIRQLEAATPHRKKVPIIALTASIINDDIQKCYDVGMDDYVAKPFKSNLLQQRIERLVDAPSPVAIQTTANEQNTTNHLSIITNTTDATEENAVSSGAGYVLLVEDNKVNQKVASTYLTKAGYRFDIAENGQQALDKYRNNTFSVILMDCMMPVMDGFEATRKIRDYETKNGLHQTPIIALTASVVDDDIQQCYDSGMNAYVSKPIKKEKLFHEIETLT